LCLGIVAVLILQTGIVLLITNFQLLHLTSIQPLLFFMLLITVLTVALLPVKGLIKTNNRNQHKLSELKKWKTDAGLFMTQWQQEERVDTTIWENDLILGDINAPILITVACNPYCGPCVKAHIQLDELLHHFPKKVKVLVRLLCNSDAEKDKRTIAVKAILQQAATLQNNTELQQMLTDWFAWMNYEKWITKWQPDNSTDVYSRLQEHNKWVEHSAVQFTPTFFINGRSLPGRYNLKDVEILIPQLIEILTNETVK
jgi:protein-disulfide isomerase